MPTPVTILTYNYTLKYQCDFVTVKNNLSCSVLFYYMDYNGPVTSVLGGADPFSLAYNTNNENKVSGIIGSKATIKIIGGEHLTTDQFTITNSDYDIKVVFTVGGVTKWTGFVIPDDVYAPYVSYPNELTIVATDNLGLLKDKELIDGNQNKFNDFYYIIDYVMACLYWTGVRIPVNTYINIFESWYYPLGAPPAAYGDRTLNPLNDPWGQLSYDSRSFEGDNSTYYKCYDVLNSILTDWDCALFQADGEFHIMRQPERIKDGVQGTKYSWVGTTGLWAYFPSDGVFSNFDGEIGINKSIKFQGASQTRGMIRQVANVKQTYNYDNIPNIIKNSNFDDTDGTNVLPRGTFSSPLAQYSGVVRHWTPHGRTIYSKIDYQANGIDIQQQYLTMLGEADAAQAFKYVESDPILVYANDKIAFSVDLATRSDIYQGAAQPTGGAGTGPQLFKVQILVTDPTGVVRYLRQDEEWTSVNTNLQIQPASDSTKWVTMSFTSNSMVISGNLTIRLYLNQACSSGNETYFKHLQLTYTAQNTVGTDTKLVKGYYYKIAQVGVSSFSVKKTIERTVGTSTKSKPAFRGCLFGAHDPGTLYKPALSMKHNGVIEHLDFVEINAVDEFNGYARGLNRLEGSCYGIQYPVLGQSFNRIVSPGTRFSISPLVNKLFMPLGQVEIHFRSETFRAVFIEIVDSSVTPADGTNIGDTILSDRFKYLY